ncbi:hypothetical protein NSQ26_13810 [Bacillus sp. FSL W7-1360]
MSLEIVESALFNGVACNFYTNEENDLFMTRDQIGKALEHTNPREAIKNIHRRNSERLDQFSRGAQIEAPSGGT